MIQGSEEWVCARCGSVGASRVHDVVHTVKSGGFSAMRKNYMAELVCERLTGEPAPQFVSAAMAYGKECEPEARMAYAFHTGVEIKEVGLIRHPKIANSHASPDGLIGDDGLVEIKCPNSAQHISSLMGGKLELEYISQMMWQLACTGRQWCDFVSYDRRLPEPMRLHVFRVLRNDDAIAKMEEMVEEFLAEVDATVALLRRKYLQEAAA